MYFAGDLNATHTNLEHNSNNTAGRQLNNLINANLVRFMGLDFRTYHSREATGKPDLLLGNNKTYFNYAVTQGGLSTSDHIPLIIKISTKPIKLRTNTVPAFNFRKAN